MILGVPLMCFFAFYYSFKVSSYIVNISLKQSFILTLLFCISLLAIMYNAFFRKFSKTNEQMYNNFFIEFIQDVIFFIPCLLIDLVEYFTNDYNNTSKTTLVLGGIMFGSLALFFMMPTINNMIRDKNEIRLLEECSELKKIVYHIPYKDLKLEISKSDGFWKKNADNIKELAEDAYDMTQKRLNRLNGLDSEYGELSCNSNKCPVKESFGPVHRLDRQIESQTLVSGFNEQEKHILDKAFEKNSQTLQNILYRYSQYPDQAKCMLSKYLKQNENYGSIMNYIYNSNKASTEYIDQRLSNLIAYLNHAYDLNETNYHYTISFWLYLDSSLIRDKHDQDIGIIMNFGGKPKMYYEFDKNELVLDINQKEGSTASDKTTKELYRTDEILYQRWNHIVVNYDYGTLDLFINNNLVGTYKNIAPYVDASTYHLSFGDAIKPLHNCAVCDIRYYNIPIGLDKIQTLYENGKK